MKHHTSNEEVVASRDALRRNFAGSRDFVVELMDKMIDLNMIKKGDTTSDDATNASGVRYYIIHIAAKERPEVETYSAADYLDRKTKDKLPVIDKVIEDDLEANTWIVEVVPVDATKAPSRIRIDSGTDRAKFLSSLEGRPVAAVLLRYGAYEKVAPLEDSEVHCYLANQSSKSSTNGSIGKSESSESKYATSYIDFLFSNDEFEELSDLKVELSRDYTLTVSGTELAASPLVTRITSDMPRQYIKSKDGKIVELEA